MRLLRFAGIFLIISMGIAATAAQAETITLDRFLGQLKQSHPLFEKEELNSRILSEEQRSFLGEQDWRVSSSLFYSHEEPSIAFASPEKTDAFQLNGGIQKLFWSSGGVFSATYSSMRAALDIDPTFGIPDNFFENKLAFTYTHPLIKNRGGILNRLEYELKQYEIDISDVIAYENQEVFLVEYALKYLDWALLVEQKNIVTERLRLSEEQLSFSKEKRAANLIDKVDVIRAEDAVRASKQNLLSLKGRFKALQAEFALLLEDDSYYNLNPEYNIYEIKYPSSLDTTIATLKKESRLLRAISVQRDLLKHSRMGFEESGKASLNLVAQANIKSADNDFMESVLMDKPDVLVGLQLDFPIGYRTSRAKISQTDIMIFQLEKQSEEIYRNLTSAAANLHTQMTELQDVLRLNRELIDSSQKKTEEELKLYNQGRSQLTFVIQSRDDERSAKLIYAINALTYHKLWIQYQALTDQLLIK